MTDRYKKWGLIYTSASLFSLSFFFPYHVGWLVFLFLLPIFYGSIALSYQLTFYDGLLWGILFFGTHFIEFLFLFIRHTSAYSACMLFSSFIVYLALYSGAWFWSVSYALVWLPDTIRWRFTLWIIGTWFYFMIVRWYIFWPFDLAGHCFGSPLLPLTPYPAFLRLMPIMGSSLLLLCLISAAASIILASMKLRVFMISAFLCLLPFMYGWITTVSNEPVMPVSLIGYVSPLQEVSGYPLDDAQKINKKISLLLDAHPEKKIIIMPESSFPFPLNNYPEVIALWQQNALSRGAYLCIGSHKSSRGYLYNTLYFVSPNEISEDYVKKKLMPFTEYLPALWRNSSHLKALFLKDKKEFSPDFFAEKQTVLAGHSFMPYICSEIYFETKKRTTPNSCIDLCVVNDAWFSTHYLRVLMMLFVQYKAIEHQRDSIYVGHYSGTYSTKAGSLIDL